MHDNKKLFRFIYGGNSSGGKLQRSYLPFLKENSNDDFPQVHYVCTEQSDSNDDADENEV